MPIEQYLQEKSALGWAATTLRVRRVQLRDWSNYVNGDLAGATRADVMGWLGTKRSANSKHANLCAVRSFYRWWADVGTGPNPGPVPDVHVKRPRGTPRPIPDDVLRPVLATATGNLRSCLILGRWAGLRASEIGAVHHDDLQDGDLVVTGKGGVRRRIPAAPLVASLVAAADGWVVPDGTGGHWCGKTVTMRVSEALPGRWTCHTLRHAYATDFYRNSGHDLLWTAEVLGHASTETTRRYVLTDHPSGAVLIGASLIPAPRRPILVGVPCLN
jgi:integrase